MHIMSQGNRGVYKPHGSKKLTNAFELTAWAMENELGHSLMDLDDDTVIPIVYAWDGSRSL